MKSTKTWSRKVHGDKTPLVFFGSLPLYSILRIYRYNYFVMLTFFVYVETYVNYLQIKNETEKLKMKLKSVKIVK